MHPNKQVSQILDRITTGPSMLFDNGFRFEVEPDAPASRPAGYFIQLRYNRPDTSPDVEGFYQLRQAGFTSAHVVQAVSLYVSRVRAIAETAAMKRGEPVAAFLDSAMEQVLRELQERAASDSRASPSESPELGNELDESRIW